MIYYGNNPLPGPTNPGGSMLPTEQYSDSGNNITTPSLDVSDLSDLNNITTPAAGGSNLNDITTPSPERPFPGPQTEGTPVTPQGWFLTPAGNQVGLGDRPYGVTQSHDGKTLLVSNNGQSTQSLQVVDRTTGAVVQTISYDSP